MRRILRASRNILAALSLIGLALVGLWIFLVGRLHAQTRSEGGDVMKGWRGYTWL